MYLCIDIREKGKKYVQKNYKRESSNTKINNLLKIMQ